MRFCTLFSVVLALLFASPHLACAQTAAQTPAQTLAGAPAVAGALSVIDTAEGVTIRLAFSKALAFQPKAFSLSDPLRLVIDINGASSLRYQAQGAGEVKSARISQFDAQTIRLVVDLTQPMILQSAYQDKGQVLELRLRPATAEAFRSQIALGRRTIAGFMREAPLAVPPGPVPAPTIASLSQDSARRIDAIEAALAEAEQNIKTPEPLAPAPAPQVEPKLPIDTRVVSPSVPPTVSVPAPAIPVTKPRPTRQANYVVMIDAGHGGHDPGAPASTGGVEKDVTLALALAARDAIRREAKQAGLQIEVKLTRGDDRYLTLGQRVRQARQSNANLFISIHADSAPNLEARGASAYTLSEVASDREAARVAAKENRADLIAGVDLSGEDREVASILVDLGMRDSMNASADFAQSLQKGMEPKGVLFRSQFHRFANFQVLRNLGVPAVLLEAGFLSNKDDSQWLFSKRGQKAIGDGIGDAVVGYLSRRAY